ncbi:MAG TPA: extracellular solute-binding protein [Jatrophihabitans sp.]|jgi:ABC-type glycerol-3-phosphate transport system substrate-binding protein|nr:extracellular solute-binding protein [Jatrophihabitans sp.]
MRNAANRLHLPGPARPAAALTALVVAGILALAGCVSGQGSSGTSAPTGGPQPGDSAHLTVLSQLGDNPALQPVLNRLNAAYMKSHPKTKVTIQYLTLDELTKTVPSTLASGSGPDVIDYDANESTIGSLANAHLLVPLDTYANSYGWHAKLTPSTVTRLTYDGHLYGVGRSSEGVGLFYNADLFRRLGIAAPTSYAAMIAAAQQLKSHGVIPFAFGDKDQWPSSHLIGAAIHSMVPVNTIKAVETLAGHGRWTDPAIVSAIATAAGWVKDGYVTPDFNGVSFAQAEGEFYTGKAGMFVEGTGVVPDLEANMAHVDVRFLPFPMKDPSAKQQMEGGLGGAWAITTASNAPAVAADWINFVHFSPEAQRAWLAAGVLPTTSTSSTPSGLSALIKDSLQVTQAAQADGGVGFWTGYASSPLVTDAWNSGAQVVLSGQQSAAAFANNLQDALDQARSGGK